MEILRKIFGYPAQELADAEMTLDTGHECGLSLHQLLMIDRHAQSLHIQDAAWILRAELTAYDGCRYATAYCQVEEDLGDHWICEPS